MNKTLEYFDYHASVYDRYQRGCVPRYGEMVTVAGRWIIRHLRGVSSPHVIDVGCGTGNTSELLLEKLPDARLTCLDGSVEMLALARHKLSGHAVDFAGRDLALPGWENNWAEGSFDAAISVLVLEHLPFGPYRRALGELLRILKPGAWMVAVEGYGGEHLQSAYFEEMAQTERDFIAAGGLSGAELEELKRVSAEKEHHYYATIDEKKQWWHEAGFADVDTVWQYYCVAVMVGRKAG